MRALLDVWAGQRGSGSSELQRWKPVLEFSKNYEACGERKDKKGLDCS